MRGQINDPLNDTYRKQYHAPQHLPVVRLVGPEQEATRRSESGNENSGRHARFRLGIHCNTKYMFYFFYLISGVIHPPHECTAVCDALGINLQSDT